MRRKAKSGAPAGFTLVEIAIVLVIIGLLLGGILKGQELINNAKVRAMADRQASLKSAWFAFLDRFAGLPGDYAHANTYITGATAGDGNGVVTWFESPQVFQHLASAGYLRCPHCTETLTNEGSTAANSLINTYGGIMSIWHDTHFWQTRGGNGAAASRLMVHTGPRIPSNIIAEVDRKIDDGSPNTGDFRNNGFEPVYAKGIEIPLGESFTGPKNAQDDRVACTSRNGTDNSSGLWANTEVEFWRNANTKPPVFQNCGGSVFI